MIKQTAKELLTLTKSGDYKDYSSHERDIEDLSKLAYTIKSVMDLLNIKSGTVQDIINDITFDLDEAEQYLDKAELILPQVEREIQQDYNDAIEENR